MEVLTSYTSAVLYAGVATVTPQEAQELAVAQARLTSLVEDVRQMQQVLRELVGIITRLALVEQQLMQTTTAMERAFKAIEAQQGQINDIRTSLPEVKRTSIWVERAVIAVVSMVMLGLIQKGFGL